MTRRTDVICYAVPEESTSPKFAAAFAKGSSGRVVNLPTALQPTAFAAFCTPPVWPLLSQAQSRGYDWYYGDHGYFRRGKYYRVTKNAYQPSGEGEATPARWLNLHVDLAPAWQTTGRSIVVCPNSPVYLEHHTTFGADEWVDDVTAQIKAATDRPIILRWKVDARMRPLSVDLQDAWMVVVFSSAAAVDALAAGVPVCTLAPWASTARMGITDLADVEFPVYPDMDERDQFLFNLADSQWTKDEIEQGRAWRALNP